jgi:hypothetical protein
MLTAVRAYMLTNAPLVALVGEKIRPLRRGQGDGLPIVVLQVAGHVPEYTLIAGIPFAETRLQVDCWAETFAGAEALARAVKAVLSGARFTSEGVVFSGVFLISERPGFEADGPTSRLVRTILEFRVWHSDP